MTGFPLALRRQILVDHFAAYIDRFVDDLAANIDRLVDDLAASIEQLVDPAANLIRVDQRTRAALAANVAEGPRGSKANASPGAASDAVVSATVATTRVQIFLDRGNMVILPYPC